MRIVPENVRSDVSDERGSKVKLLWVGSIWRVIPLGFVSSTRTSACEIRRATIDAWKGTETPSPGDTLKLVLPVRSRSGSQMAGGGSGVSVGSGSGIAVGSGGATTLIVNSRGPSRP